VRHAEDRNRSPDPERESGSGDEQEALAPVEPAQRVSEVLQEESQDASF